MPTLADIPQPIKVVLTARELAEAETALTSLLDIFEKNPRLKDRATPRLVRARNEMRDALIREGCYQDAKLGWCVGKKVG